MAGGYLCNRHGSTERARARRAYRTAAQSAALRAAHPSGDGRPHDDPDEWRALSQVFLVEYERLVELDKRIAERRYAGFTEEA